MKQRLVCLLVVLSAIARSFSQNMVVTELPTQGLLPVSPVHRVIQDREGYMWYATEGGGLCRDDGYEMTIFRSPFPFQYARYNIIGSDSILNNYVTDLAEDKVTDKIWFATWEGLYSIDKSDYSVKTVSHPQLRHAGVFRLLAASDGRIWASTGEGIFSFDGDGGNLRHYKIEHNGNALKVNFLHEDANNVVRALCTDKTILRYDKGSDTFVKEKIDIKGDPVYMSEGIDKGSLFLAVWGRGVALCTPLGNLEWRIEELPGTINATDGRGIVLNFIYDRESGILWVSALDNLYAYRINNKNVEPFVSDLFPMRNKKVIDYLFKDRDENIWVPGYTPHTFILSYDKDKIERYPVDATRQTTGYPLMADLVVREDEYFWIWLGRDNLALYNAKTDDINYLWDRSRNSSAPASVAKCLEKDINDEGIWAADGNRLYHLSHRGMDIDAKCVLEIEGALYIEALHESEHNLLIGTNEGIYQMNTLNASIRKISGDIKEVKQISTSSDGTMYAAIGKGGLLRIDNKGKRSVIASGENLKVVTIAPDGTVWTASEQGNVYSYNQDGGTLRCENDNCLASGESIKGIVADRSGHIWMLSDQYVKEYNPANKAFRIYHTSDKRIGMDYMHSVRLVGDNKVCVGGMGAICFISSSPDLDKSNPSNIKPVVTSVKTYRRNVLNGVGQNEISISPDESDIQVTFSTFDHLHAKNVSYAYRLAGIQDFWTNLAVGNNTASFSQLPKGKYCLEVRATDRYGRWGEPVKIMTIHRLPAWYETWWAYILYAILLIAVAYGARWLYIKTNQLVELHRRRKEVVLNTVEINIDESALPTFDKELLNKAASLVEAHISDSEYNVEQLSSDMCMSRMSLYRKLQIQTGQSPLEFIRDIRLKKAASLLSTTNLSIKEVMLQCGFSTPAYFRKVFKKMFGVVPGEYRNSKTGAPSKS